MNSALLMLAFGLTIVGGLAVAAYLITKGHPWFGLLVILVVSSISMKTKT